MQKITIWSGAFLVLAVEFNHSRYRRGLVALPSVRLLKRCVFCRLFPIVEVRHHISGLPSFLCC